VLEGIPGRVTDEESRRSRPVQMARHFVERRNATVPSAWSAKKGPFFQSRDGESGHWLAQKPGQLELAGCLLGHPNPFRPKSKVVLGLPSGAGD
jgi:hypothetical protein